MWFSTVENRMMNPMQPSLKPMWSIFVFSRNKGRRKLKSLYNLLTCIYEDQENAEPRYIASKQTLSILGHFLGRTSAPEPPLPPYLEMFSSSDVHLTDFKHIRSLKNPVLTRIWMFEKILHLQQRKDLEWKQDYGSKLDTYNTWQKSI
jgi:hypothetical protein